MKTCKNGRSAPGYSNMQDGKLISNKQTREWLMELLEKGRSACGYRVLIFCLKGPYKPMIN